MPEKDVQKMKNDEAEEAGGSREQAPFSIKIKRIYLPADPDDGCRILTDRLWPRGIAKEKAGLDEWRRDTAPSSALRKSFHHQAERFGEFREAYRAELDANPAASELVHFCEMKLQAGNVTFLYAAEDEACNNAAVLRGWVTEHLDGSISGE